MDGALSLFAAVGVRVDIDTGASTLLSEEDAVVPRPGVLLDFLVRPAGAEVASAAALLLDLLVLFEVAPALLDGGEYCCRAFFFLEDRRSLAGGVILFAPCEL